MDNYYVYTEEEVKALKFLYSLDRKSIGRDSNGSLYGFLTENLVKDFSTWVDYCEDYCEENYEPFISCLYLELKKSLFPNIKWEDKKTLNIKKELERIGEL